MNLRNLFRLFSVLHLLTGLVWMLAPQAMPASYGMDIDAYAAFMLRQLGAFNIAMAVLFFLVSGMAHSPARQAVVTFVIVLQVLSAIAYLPAIRSGALPAGAGWFGPVFSVVAVLAFGYFRFVHSEPRLSPGIQS